MNDFELGIKLGKLASDSGIEIDSLIDRIIELRDNHKVSTVAAENYIRSVKATRRAPAFHVVGSKVHPRHHEVVSLRQKGLTVIEISKKIGLNKSILYAILARAGMNRLHRIKPNQNTEKIKVLAGQGLNTKEIAAKLHITTAGVRYQANRYGIPVKGPTMAERASGGAAAYWANKTPAERSAEMRRRRHVAIAKHKDKLAEMTNEA